jgi:hypothetical protein
VTSLRARYSHVESLVEFIEATGGPPCDVRRWQPWVLDHHQAQLRHREIGCCVNLADSLRPRDALGQVQEVARSTWATEAAVRGLLAALHDIAMQPFVAVPAHDLNDIVARAVARTVTHAWRTQP